MRKEQYDFIMQPARESAQVGKAVVGVNCALTAVGYIAFPLLVVLQACLSGWGVALKTCVICAVGFCVVSVARHVINSPRPYEVLDIKPLVDKKTSGKSMPSRHAFCRFLIAFAWLNWCFWAGCVLVAFSVVLGVLRVVLGVHWPRDVVCAFVCACVFGAVFVFM